MTTFPHLLQVCGSMQKPCLNKKGISMLSAKIIERRKQVTAL